MGEQDGEQQRLLLTGRTERGGLRLGSMDNGEILAVRAGQGAAGGGIAAALAREAKPQGLLARFFLDRQQGTGEGLVGLALQRSLKAADQIGTGSG